MKKSSTIRALEHKAENGDIIALFQLAEYYKQGVFVDEDHEQANLYANQATEIFIAKQSLKIASIKLVGFRIFENVEIDFSNNIKPNLTVIIGDNGAGKSTILDAIAKTLSHLIINIIRQGGKGESLKIADINNNSHVEYASIITKLKATDNTSYNFELSKVKDGNKSSKQGYYQEIKLLADLYKSANFKDNQFNLPLMALYSANRTIEIKNTYQPDINKHWTKYDGYKNSLKGITDFESFFHWFESLENINNASDKQNLHKLSILQEQLINEMQTNPSSELIQSKLEEIKILQKSSNQSQSNKIILTITQAICKFIPSFENLRIQRAPLYAVLVDKDGLTLNVQQLSQGEKSLIALVADITYRLVLLNPSLSDPLEGSGIVLIDEIDLHLHPTWQQSVIPNLLKTFPNIQFIASTHSPQVLSTIDYKCIRKLVHEIDGETGQKRSSAKPRHTQTKGVASTDIMDTYQETDPVPDIAEARMLSEYKAMIQNNLNQTEEGQQLLQNFRQKLNAHFGSQHQEILECDRLIRLIDMKKKLLQRK